MLAYCHKAPYVYVFTSLRYCIGSQTWCFPCLTSLNHGITAQAASAQTWTSSGAGRDQRYWKVHCTQGFGWEA